ncbi:MAG: NIL domain-containing protein [candidate division WOR-3 bacterium]
MKLFLRFPSQLLDKPIISALIREKGVEINILRASVSPREIGEMVVDIPEDAGPAIEWLEAAGVSVIPLAEKIVRHEERCVDCGSCVGVCLSGALHMKNDALQFDPDACFFCLFCIDSCPTQALEALE